MEWSGVLELAPKGFVSVENYANIANLQESVEQRFAKEGVERLSGNGLVRDEHNTLMVTNFMLCLWVWLRFFTKSASPLSYALSNDRSNALLLGFEYEGIFFAFMDKEYRVRNNMQTSRWYHICMARNENQFDVYLDGILAYSDTSSIKTAIPLNGSLVLGQDQDNHGGGFNPLQSFVGKITGLKLWTSNEPIVFESDMCLPDWIGGSPLMIDLGQLYWNVHGDAQWTNENPCYERDAPVYLVWPQSITFEQSIEFCSSLHLHIPQITNETQNTELATTISVASALCFGFLSNFKYAWISNEVECQLDLDDAAVFYKISPNFNARVNDNACSVEDNSSLNHMMLISTGEWRVAGPDEMACSLCTGNPFNKTFYLSNLCWRQKNTRIKFYPRVDGDIFYFHGDVDLLIISENEQWMITTHSRNEVASLVSSINPIGRNNWTLNSQVRNCHYIDASLPLHDIDPPVKSELILSSCSEDEFVCGDGQCIPSSERCSGAVACSDNSDETNCNFIAKPSTYDHLISPPGRNLKLDIEITLTKVRAVDIAKQTIQVQMNLSINWKDMRLKYHNLKDDMNLNLVSYLPYTGIWLPYIELEAEDRLAGKVDPQVSLFLNKSGPSSFDGQNNIVNGEDASIVYFIEYDNTVNCVFDLRLYPFDVQTCSVVFSIVNVPKRHVLLSVKEIEVVLLHRHLPTDYSLSNTTVTYNDEGRLYYTMKFERFPAYPVLAIYIPTVLMHAIGYGTLFIPAFDFQDRGTMSLTTLLVLISLYTDTMNTLPVTSYVKLLDIWFLFSVAYISMIVMAHLFTSNNDVVRKLGTKKRYSLPGNESVLKACKIAFGTGYILFHFFYWLKLGFSFTDDSV